jgi:hypothetical protein
VSGVTQYSFTLVKKVISIRASSSATFEMVAIDYFEFETRMHWQQHIKISRSLRQGRVILSLVDGEPYTVQNCTTSNTTSYHQATTSTVINLTVVGAGNW